MEKEFEGVIKWIGRPGLRGVVFWALMKLENQPWACVDGEDPKAVKEKLRGLKIGDTVVLKCEVLHNECEEYRIVEIGRVGVNHEM